MKKDEAKKLFGSLKGVADALGITRQAVSRWGDSIPPLRVYQIREIISERKEEKNDEI